MSSQEHYQAWLSRLSDNELQMVYGMSCVIVESKLAQEQSTDAHEGIRRELDRRGHHPHHFDESSNNQAVLGWLKRKRGRPPTPGVMP